MSLLAYYQTMYAYETDCDQKMLAMLESVSEAQRSDARFQRAVMLAGHLAACRENWLAFMQGDSSRPVLWFDPQCDFAALRPRFTALASRWTDYLAHLEEDRLPQDFEFSHPGEGTFTLPIEVQIVQLMGHAHYHRGQIALLVDQLGGETIDTDYADWWWMNRREAS